MSATDNLMQRVYDYFLDLYHQSGSPQGSTVLAFQPIGTAITPNMFKLKPKDTDFSPALAIEQFSSLTNGIPAIDTDVFQRTMKTIDQSYDFLLEGSFPSSNDNPEDVTVFSNFKAQAKKSFDEIKLGSLLKPATQFHPAYATPSDWYDVSQDANWTTYSSTMSTSSSASTSSIQTEWQWQVLPKELAPIVEQPEVIDRLSTISTLDLKDVVLHPETDKVDTSSVVLRPDLETRLGSVLKVDLASQKGRMLSAELPASGLVVAALGATTLMPEILDPIDVSKSHIASWIDRSNVVVAPRIPIDAIPINRIPVEAKPEPQVAPISSPMIQIARFEELRKQTTQTTVVSTSLTVSFKYCLIQIDRPWISQAYLETKGWYVPRFASGSFSTGSFENNSGEFPVIPLSFILIKDLQITDWSEAETEIVERSAGFGPFSFIGRTIDLQKRSLTCAGAQIVGWVSQVMPLLPPDQDPVICSS